MDIRVLQGPLSRRYQEVEAAKYGTFCAEWVPYLAITGLKLFSATGDVVNVWAKMRTISKFGTLLKDILHWKWLSNGTLLVTVLIVKVTATVRRQTAALMLLLMINFPQLLQPGDHSGRVHYTTTSSAHLPIHLRVDAACRLKLADKADSRSTEVPPVPTHRALLDATQRVVGPETKVATVHPHPRISRIVSLWAGDRRWKTPRKTYKHLIRKHTDQQSREHSRAQQRKWHQENGLVATGLDSLAWKRIRRVVGLNPWGEQILLRLKHHAASIYNPVSAGLDCPHSDCARLGRVDLAHVFWSCPAAAHLRAVLVDRWKAAGLRLPGYEQAIFSLQLPTVPSGMAVACGKVIDDYPAAQAALVGDAVERMTNNCWSIGAALYLLAVWRWRVAHFDPMNDISRAYHVAGLANRLRAGHRDVTQDIMTNADPELMIRLRRRLCAVLGADWRGQPEVLPYRGCCFIIFFAGAPMDTTRIGASGTVIVRVHEMSGTFQTQYIGSTRYEGGGMGTLKAAQLGLLRGLRECIAHGWGPVHVVGDNQEAVRQQTSRHPPRATHLRDSYWKTRRAADAAAVATWVHQHRDQNRTANGFARMARLTEQSVEWKADMNRPAGTKGAVITDHIQTDVTQWFATREKSTLAEGAEGPV